MEDSWGFWTQDRIAVTVVDGPDPVADVPVELQDADGATIWQARTDNAGEAELFPNLFDETFGPYTVSVGEGSKRVTEEDVLPAGETRLEISYSSAAPEAVLDLMFIIDTTGSMGDELSYLQSELEDAIERVTDEQAIDVRLALTFYRDDGDAYVVRSFGFSDDISGQISSLNSQSAGGGGDYEEAVEEAMEDAVSQDWSDSARARLAFLVLDAPPHHTSANIASLQASTMEAAELGIRVIPVAASGVDKDTEFLLRFMDVSTGGTYTFLTNHSGIGNDHIRPTVGQVELEYLNDLIVRLISEAVE